MGTGVGRPSAFALSPSPSTPPHRSDVMSCVDWRSRQEFVEGCACAFVVNYGRRCWCWGRGKLLALL